MQENNQQITPKQILDVAGVIIISFDKKGNIITINKYGCKLLGYSQKEIVKKNWFDNFIPKNLVKNVKQVFNKIISGKLKPVEYFDNSIFTRKGEEKIISWHNAFIKDKKGKITGVISSGIDMTAEKNTEREKERVMDMLSVIRNVNQLILREENKEKLLKSVVRILELAKGYNCVFLATFKNKINKIDSVYYRGSEKLSKKQLQKIYNIQYINKTIKKKLFVLEDATKQHFKKVPKHSAMVALLSHTDINFGILTIHLPANVKPNKEILSLFKELSNDIAYALYGIENNIEKVKAEKELQKSREIFRKTLDSMLEGCQIIGFDWRYIYVNDAVAKHGRKTKKELIGHTMMEVYPGIENTAMFDVLRYCMKKRVHKTLINKFTYANGDIAWFELSVQPVTEGIFILSNDITERKRIEEALKSSEEKFRNLIEFNPLSIQGYGVDGTVHHWNKASEKVYGYIAKEAVGKNLGDLIIPSNVKPLYKKALQIGKKAKKSGELLPSGEIRLLKKDGSFVDVYSTHVVVKNKGREPEMFCIDLDLTEIKKAEEKYRNLVNTLKDIIYIADKNAVITFVTPNVEDYGYKAEEVIGKNLSYFVHPDDLAKVEKDFKETIIKGREFPTQFRLKKKNGDYIITEDFGACVIDEKGEVSMHGVLRDITEKTKMQEKLAESEKKYRSIFDTSPEAIVVVDSKGHMIEVNGRINDWLGYDKKELIGKYLLKLPFLTAKTKLIIAEKFAERILGKNIGPYDVDFIAKNDEIKIGRINAAVMKDSKGDKIDLVIVSDVTENRKALNKYKSVIENATEMILVLQDGAVKMANPKTIEVSDYTLKELTSKPFSEFVYPDDRDFVTKNYIKRLKGKNIPPYDFRILKKKGGYFWVHITAVSLEWDGKPAVLIFLDDITERKQAEERFKAVAETTSDFIYEWYTKEGRLEWFGKFDEALGYKKREVSRTVNGWLNIIHPDDRAVLIKSVEYHTKNKSPIDEEYRVIKKDGTVLYWHSRGNPIQDSDGKIVKWIGGCTDITERKKAENALKEAEAKYRDIVENSPEIIHSVNAQGKIIFANKKESELLGYSNEELMGMNIRDIYSPKLFNQVQTGFKQLKKKGALYIPEGMMIKKDGTEINVEIDSLVVYGDNGKFLHTRSIIRDVTERKSTELELKKKVEQMEFMGKLNLKRHKKMLFMEKKIQRLKKLLKEKK